MRILKTITICFICILGLACVTTMALVIAARREEDRARRCLTEVLGMDMQRTTFEEVNRLFAEYGGTTTTSVGHPCGPEFCDFSVRFQNRMLSRFGLAPFTGLSIGVVVFQGHAANRGIWFESDGNPAYFVVETTATEDRNGPQLKVMTDLAERPNKIMVRLTSGDSPDVRARAFSVNLSCLSRLGSCRNPLLAPLSQHAN